MKTFIALGLVAAAPFAAAQEKDLAKLPKYLTPVPYAGIRNWHVTQNLGATGARGWIYGHTVDSHESREILIKSIETASPADGILKPYDVIVGAAVPPNTPPSSWTTAPELKPFDSDARLSMARAITWAESDLGKGELKLLVARDGEAAKPVTIQLPVMGTYADIMPYACPKSQRIVQNAAVFVASNMPADGYPEGVGRPLNAAFLLATHDPQYLDHVRRSAIRMSELHTISDAGHETWRWGNTNTFLCEYYLATGDKRVLPTIKEYSERLRDGQCNPGTWGHSSVPDFIPPGYGSVNSTGIICFYSLILANQCGVHVADKAIENSIGFYGGFAGRGGVPYGDHPPYNATTCGGKNGTAALAFHLLGANDAGQWFARLCASSNLQNFEGGHSGNYFNQTWSPLGAQLAGDQNYINFWKRFHSYRDLARRWDGSFIAQPWPNKREGDLGSGNYVNKGPIWNTGSFALSYLAGTDRLAMLGRTESVFGENPPAALKPALELYHAKDFAGAAKAAAEFASQEDTRISNLASQLQGAAERNLASIEMTLDSMRRTLDMGDLFTLKYQLLGIESIIDASDDRLKLFREALEGPDAEENLKLGAVFHQRTMNLGWQGEKGFSSLGLDIVHKESSRNTLKQFTKKPETFYGKASNILLNGDWPGMPPFTPLGAGKALVSAKAGPEHKAGKTHTLNLDFDITDTKAINDLYFSYMMAKNLKAHLNGTLILDLKFDQPDPKPVNLLLKPVTRELLKNGKNTLSIDVTPGGPGLELSLKQGL